ncbi:MAG: serine/threonine-protein kinase [Planctomycetaceae bacterium]
MTASLDPHWAGFLQTAGRLNLLSAEVVAQLTDESRIRQRSPAELVVQRGWLNPVQVDIVTTLMHPTTTIPGYEILSVIGQGGMGVVYRAKQLNLDRIVALKTVLFSQLGDQNVLGRFRQEAITVAKLRHPNIVAAYDFGQHEGRLYFAMEMIEGHDLDAVIRQNDTLDAGTSLGLLRQTVAGLAHASQMGIVHRDIKPANLLLVETPEGYALPNGLPMVKIADFGLAFLTAESDSRTRLTMNNAAVGSPNYLAPEQLSGQPVDHRADVYALGATLYHMLSGRPPYAAENVAQIITQKLSGHFKPIARLPDSLNQFLQSLMKVDPAERPADYGLIRQEIDRQTTTLVPEMIFISAGRPSLTAAPDLSDGVRQQQGGARQDGSESRGTRTHLPLETQPIDPHVKRHDVETTLIMRRASHRRRSIIGVLAGVLAATGIFYALWGQRESERPQPQRTLTRGEWVDHLFDGRTLSGWSTVSGGWSIKNHEDLGAVLSGERGTIRRQLIRRGNVGASSFGGLENYILTLLVTLHQAERVMLEFGLKEDSNNVHPRLVLRIGRQGLQLGRQGDDAKSFVPLSGEVAYNLDPLSPVEIQIERQQRDWWVILNGKILGILPIEPDDELPEFRLTVEGGPAFFSDFIIQELQSSANPADEH